MKIFLFLFSSVFFVSCFAPDQAFAQARVLKNVRAAVRSASKSTGSKVRFSSRSLRVPAVPAHGKLSKPVVAAAPSVTLPSVALPKTELSREPNARLVRSMEQLKAENIRLKGILSTVEANLPPLLRSTFHARQTGVERTNFFSGTVFKTVYNGQEEIYGVVAAHAIASSASDRALNRNFTADVYSEGKFVSVEAEIVQSGAPSLLDVALVKFRPEDEILFRPLEISEVPVQLGELLSSQGFANKSSVNIPGRYTLDVTPVSLRTTMPFARSERPGLCGSAVVNADNRLVGIHTGSVPGRFSEQDDVGFATNAKFLNTLVEAYHNGGKAEFPFVLNKQKIVDLNVDEYISYVSLQDANGKMVWQKGFDSKFPYGKVKEVLEIYAPRYIQLTVRRAHWDENNPDIFVEVRSSRDRNRTTYTYDLAEQKIVSVTKPKPKR